MTILAASLVPALLQTSSPTTIDGNVVALENVGARHQAPSILARNQPPDHADQPFFVLYKYNVSTDTGTRKAGETQFLCWRLPMRLVHPAVVQKPRAVP